MLMSNLWKSMKSAFEDDNADYSDPAHGAMDEWGMDAMCSAVGKSGGLGIAKLIMKDLAPKIEGSQASKGGAGG
jgi:Rod binding domain-containing protein